MYRTTGTIEVDLGDTDCVSFELITVNDNNSYYSDHYDRFHLVLC